MARTVHTTQRQDLRPVALLLMIVAVVAVAALILVGGGISGLWWTGHWAWPSGHLFDALGSLLTDPGHPSAAYPESASIPAALGFWITVGAVEMAFLFVATFAVVVAVVRRGEYGMMTRSRMKKAMKRGRFPGPSDRFKFMLGKQWNAALSRSRPLIAPVGRYLGLKFSPLPNDAALVVAPQQSGKTTRVAVGRIKDAPGAVVTTGTKVDIVDLTAGFREVLDADPAKSRWVHIFDPDDLTGWPDLCRWNIVLGCEDSREAETRAAAMIAAAPSLEGSGGNTAFFKGQATTVLKCFLHAAALDGKTMRDVYRWANNFSDTEPYRILTTHPGAIADWHQELSNATGSDARETVGSTSLTLAGALGSLSRPEVMDLVCCEPAHSFNIQQFIDRGRDTLYVLSEGGAGVTTAPLVTAFVSSIIRAARRHSQRFGSGRLEPMMSFVLDEAANVAPIPEMGMMLSDGGGRGMSTWAILQSFSQARKRWTEHGWGEMWGASSLKLILPGCSETDDLEKVSRLVGERKVVEESFSSSGLFGSGNVSSNRSTRLERIMPVDAIQQLDDGTGLLMWKNAGNAVINLPAWWERDDHADFEDSIRSVQIRCGRADKNSSAGGDPLVSQQTRDALVSGKQR